MGMLFLSIPLDRLYFYSLLNYGSFKGAFQLCTLHFGTTPRPLFLLFYSTSNILKSSRWIWLIFCMLWQILLGSMNPNHDSGKFLVLAQTWFVCTIVAFVRYSLYVTKVARLFRGPKNIFIFTRNFLYIIFMSFKAYSKQKITYFLGEFPTANSQT